MKHKYTKRRKMVSNKNNNKKNKQNKKNKTQKLSMKRNYQKGGMDTASADLDPPAYRDSYDETIYSKLNK